MIINKSARLALVVIAVVIFGATVYLEYSQVIAPVVAMHAMLEDARISDRAYRAYRKGSYKQGQQALESDLRHLHDTGGSDLDITLTWSRLAVLHERNNNARAAAGAW